VATTEPGHDGRVSQDWRGLVSAREAEVLAAIGAHQTNAQIAGRLHLSVRTVESHVSSLLRKVGVADRRALATAASTAATPVPAATTSFVGRAAEQAEVHAALGRYRLVSLLGPGGVGKTRLATEVARHHDAAFVDLVPVRAGRVARAVAEALGVPERPGESLTDGLLHRLRDAPSLLVVDNCEHLLSEVGPLVERILAGCPGVTVLATSRERLGLPGERTLPVPPLPLSSDAEALLADRARAADPAFAADPAELADLCARLDGIPLAIELAAARIGSLGTDGLRTALRDRLRLLAGGRGRDQRHRSLRAVIGWSHDLLDPAERVLFRRLSVFAGGFDLAAAGATNPHLPPAELADVLGRLVDKSLVARGAGRWRMLETVRAFAAELLAAGGDGDVRDRYLRWAAGTAGALEQRIDGDWHADFDLVADDLRAALASTAAVPDPVAYRLAAAFGHLSYARRRFAEAGEHYRAAAARAADGGVADLRLAADVALAVADGPAAYDLLRACAAAAEGGTAAVGGNARAHALAYAVVVVARYPAGWIFALPEADARALLDEAVAGSDGTDAGTEAMIATARAWLGGPEERLARDAVRLAREAGDPVLVLGALDAHGTAVGNAGRLREARALAEERVRIAERLPPHDPRAGAEIVDAVHVASTTAVSVGDLPTALAIARGGLLGDPLGDHPYLAAPRLIRALALTGRLDEAAEHADALWERWRRAGSPPAEWMASAIATAALAHGLRGDGLFPLWRRQTQEVAGPDTGSAAAAFVDARVAVHTGTPDDAAGLVDAAFAPFRESWWQPYAHAAGAELAVVAGLPDAPARLAAAQHAADENDWAAACLTRARGRQNRALLKDAARQWERIDARFEHACTLRLLADG
jgi:predicted ATPase/DNA-binding CsgD family transcriptional regulator